MLIAFEDAINIARGARFEHGENPKVLCPPVEKWLVHSLGLSAIDGGGREWWIESETKPGEEIYVCGNDLIVPNAAQLAADIVQAHNCGDRNQLRYLCSLLNMLVPQDDEKFNS